jgi:erythromycin esterase-like protein
MINVLAQHAATIETQYREAIASLVADSDLVLIGDASHGTSEFYRERANLTKRLIEAFGFNAVVVEADWPDAYRVDRFVCDASDDSTPEEALRGFQRFPLWMWRNWETADFLEWLRAFNTTQPSRMCGFYGMDLYSLHASMRAVVRYLEQVDPEAAKRARERYSCFDRYGTDPQHYDYLAMLGDDGGCLNAVKEQFREIESSAKKWVASDRVSSPAAFFVALQNARLALNAEEYYRAMFTGRVNGWNLRDSHMTETLEALERFLQANGIAPKIVVWAHNSHLGNAAATEMSTYGEFNVGELTRKRKGSQALSIGMTTYSGSVMAADDWDGPHSEHLVQPALEGSFEDLFHFTTLGADFALVLRDAPRDLQAQLANRLERAIGVVYRPRTERQSHYFQADIVHQFDVVMHIDRTHAVQPLDPFEPANANESPATYPTF